MKVAFITDLNGRYIEPTLVAESVTGVFDILETIPVAKGAQQPANAQPTVTGYTVAVLMPDGLYSPVFDVAGYKKAVQEYHNQYARYRDALAQHDPKSTVPAPQPPAEVDGATFWRNGLTQAEIDALQPKPQLNQVEMLGQQLVERELEVMELKAQNASQGATLVNLELRLLQIEGAGVRV